MHAAPQRRLRRFQILAHNPKKFFWTKGIPRFINASHETDIRRKRRIIPVRANSMFHLFPNSRQAWLRILLLPFQAYAILAPISYCYFLKIWPHSQVGPLNNFGNQLSGGSFICFIVLLAVGLFQKGAGKYVNLCLAGLSALEIYLTPNWIQV